MIDSSLLAKTDNTNMDKKQSSCIPVRTYEIFDVFQRAVKLAESTQEKLNLSLDDTITVLREYKWNKYKMQEKWFDDMETLEVKIGIKFD